MYTITTSQSTSTNKVYSASVARAKVLAVRDNEAAKVVHTATGALVFQTSPQAIAGVHFTPFTRTEKVSFELPNIEGYVLAYVRTTALAGVYRPLDKGQAWIVTSPKGTVSVPNTKAARLVTNELVAEAKADRLQVRATAKAAKVAAREAKALASV